MRIISALLSPFSLLYGGVMRVRNTLYDKNFLKSQRFNLPIISIGNLTVGGTGKTPHVEYLLRLLPHKQVATLSRGYKRESKGFILADNSASAASLGDKPFQYYLDYPQVSVAVAENRAEGIRNLLMQVPNLEVIILDDAYQHRGVQPSLNILLTDYSRLFYQDLVLPAGRLREFPRGANRADVVIISKCPQRIPGPETEKIKKKVSAFINPKVPVFFTRYTYGNLVPCLYGHKVSKKALIVTAIANAQPFINYLQEQEYKILHHCQFSDHYAFTESDLRKIFMDWQRYSQDGPVSIITTRKDAVKLTNLLSGPEWQKVPFFYLPIKVTFMQDQSIFDALILNHLANYIKPENN